MSYNVDENLASVLISDNTMGAAQPGEAMRYLFEVDKLSRETEDPDFQKLLGKEMEFFKLAVRILSVDEKERTPAHTRIMEAFGENVEGAIRLSQVLRKIARQKQAEELIKTVLKGDEKKPITIGKITKQPEEIMGSSAYSVFSSKSAVIPSSV